MCLENNKVVNPLVDFFLLLGLIYKYIRDKNKTNKMINPEVKSRINKIDFELKAFFEHVYIKEKYYKTGYFEISANTIGFIFETKEYKRLEAKLIINQPDLLQENIKWSYSTNPLDENALWLDRVSTLETISLDIINIIKEKRLSEDYIFNLEPIVESINENVLFEDESEQEVKTTMVEQIKSILEYYNVEVANGEEIILTNENSFNSASDRIVKIYHNTDIKISDKFRIESSLNSLEEVNWTLFKEGFIEVSWTPSLDEISSK
jgi:hypothetical protein